MLPSTDFKSVASTNSATSPLLEVPIGFEPMITELQSVALPLGQGTVLLTVLTYYTITELKCNTKKHLYSKDLK